MHLKKERGFAQNRISNLIVMIHFGECAYASAQEKMVMKEGKLVDRSANHAD